MRLLIVLVVVAVFAALMILDTAALMRLGWSCVTGGCGVSPIWIVAAVGGMTLVAWLASRWPALAAKKGGARRVSPAKGGVRAKAGVRGKAGSRAKAGVPRKTKRRS